MKNYILRTAIMLRRGVMANFVLAMLLTLLCSLTAKAEDVTNYNLWLSGEQVTSANKDDILSDGGKAKFDPATNTLTLDGIYGLSDADPAAIYAKGIDLTIKGNANYVQGIRVEEGNLILNGDFSILIGIEVSNNLIVQGGSLVVSFFRSALYCKKLFITSNVEFIELRSDGIGGVRMEGEFAPGYAISYPKGAYLDYNEFRNPDGSDPDMVIIVPRREKYDLWIGNTQVTTDNCLDIFNDRKACFDPSTNTLTLNEPTINGTHTFGENKTAVIYSERKNLIVNGKYHQTEASAHYGIATGNNDLAIGGDFDFRGTNAGIQCKTLTVQNSTSNLILQGESKASEATGIVLGDRVHMSTPTNGVITKGQFYESDGTTIAKKVAIEYVNYYNLWLGSTQVNELNMSDILGDGKACFDPETNTLTLNNPNINSTHSDCKIYSKIYNLTIKGNYHMSEAPEMGICSLSQNLTLDGSFTFLGTKAGIYAKELTVKTGTLKSIGGKDGIIVADNLIVKPDVTKIELEGSEEAIEASNRFDGFEGTLGISYPQNGEIKTNYGYRTIFEADGKTIAKKVIIEPGYNFYNLWVGSKRVTIDNYQDILGDGGKAKFNPDTKTLTLNEPTISDTHTDNNNITATISSNCITLTINGSYHMTKANADYGIMVRNGKLRLNGDFTIYGNTGGIFSGDDPATIDHNSWTINHNEYGEVMLDGNITLDGKSYGLISAGNTILNGNCVIKGGENGIWATSYGNSVKMNGGTINIESTTGYGICCQQNTLVISGAVNKVSILSWKRPAFMAKDLIINNAEGQNVELTSPKGAYYSPTYKCVFISDSDYRLAAGNVIFSTPYYKLWVGNTQVNGANKDNILNQIDSNGNPTAQYDPETKTLTLNDPVINSNTTNTNGNTYTILSAENLTIKGKYRMTESTAMYGVSSAESLTLDGELTFKGSTAGIFAYDNISLSGNISGIGQEGSAAGIYVQKGDINVINGYVDAIGENYGLYAQNGKLILNEGVEKVSLKGTINGGLYVKNGLAYPTIGESKMYITNPSGAFFNQEKHSIYHLYTPSGISVTFDNNVSTYIPAKNAIIERAQPYNIWVGSTQVMSTNKDDILNDGGKAQYDPETKTLTLDNPEINSVHEFVKYNTPDEQHTATIYAQLGELTIKGGYQMTAAAADYGVMAEISDLILDGDFTFKGTQSAVSATCLRLGNNKKITAPTDAVFDSQVKGALCEADGSTVATTATIQTVYAYNLYLGNTRVTSLNQDDILGDGKAKYDPETGILTLNSPTIQGATPVSSKIYSSGINLTLRGRYAMSEMETGVGVGLDVRDGTLTTEGDFAFYGEDGVTVNNNFTVMGRLKAIGGDYGYGVYCRGGDGHGLTLVPGLMIKTRLEMKGGNAAMSSDNLTKYTISSGCSREIVVDGGRIVYDAYIMDTSNKLVKEAVLRFDDSDDDGSAENPYVISSSDDWYALSHEIAFGEPTAGKYFCLYNNSVEATTTLGTAEHPFSGTFYGWTEGAELTVNLNQEDTEGCAPFQYISGATIKDLMIRGSVKGGQDCAGLVGYVSGGTNLIQDCGVAASISTYDQHCGGILGHAGNATTTLNNCAFGGSIYGLTRVFPGAMQASTLVGQAGSDATLTLTGCMDLSEDSRPIGQGTVNALTVNNTYYIYTGNKKNTDIGSWSGKAKLGYSVEAGSNNYKLILADGSLGAQSYGTIYAAETESVNFTVYPNDDIFIASAGNLTYDNGVYTLEMPAQNVVISANSSEFYDIAVMVVPLKQEETEVHGTITPSSDKSNAGKGISLKITPDEGYWLAAILVYDENNHEVTTYLQEDLLRSPYAFFVMPSSKVKVYAAFQPKYSFDAETGELTLLCGDFNYQNKFAGVTASEVKSVTAVAKNEQTNQSGPAFLSGVRFCGVCEALFAGFSNCETMDLSNVNTETMTSTENMFYGCSKMTTLNLDGWNAEHVTNSKNMFYGCSKMTTLNLEGWDAEHVTNSKNMFYGCYALNHLTLSPKMGITADMNLSNARYGWMAEGTTTVVSGKDEYAVIPAPATTTTYLWAKDVLGYAYEYDSETKTLTLNWGDYYYRDAGWKDITITDVEHIVAKDDVRFVGNCVGLFMYFTNCQSIDLRRVDVSEMTSMESMFYGCKALTSLNTFGWNTGKVTNMNNAFKECESMEYFNITLWNTEKVETMNGLFDRCKNLKSIDLSGMNTSNVWDMSNLFYGCSELEEVNMAGLNTPKLATMLNMFYGCTKLSKIDLKGINAEKVSSVSNMFRDCTSLTELDLSGLNLSNVMQMSHMFDGCTTLKTLNLSTLSTRKALNMGYGSLIEWMFKDANALSTLILGPNTKITEAMTLTSGAGEQGWTKKGDPTVVSGNGIYATLDAPHETTEYIWKYLTDPISLYNDFDNNPIISYWDGYMADVTLQGRTLYKDGDWNTLCLPFNLTPLEIAESPLAGADIRTLSSASFEDGTLTLNFTPAVGDDPSNPDPESITGIEPGVPYIVRWTRANDYVDDDEHNIVDPTFKGVTLCKDIENFTSTDQKVSFNGNYNYMRFTEPVKNILFLGSNNRIYYPQPDTSDANNPKYPSIGAQRAYFQLNAPATVKEFILNFEEDSETSLSEELRVKSEECDDVYDLNGRKINCQLSTVNRQLPKGIYIVNGKKILK